MYWYVLSITVTSQGTEDRKFTPYTDKDVALRKFYEVFGGIGGGSKKITVLLLDSDLNRIKREQWILEESEVE